VHSYPECRVFAEGYDGAREFLNERANLGRLPTELQSWLDGETGNEWFPEAIGVCAEMMAADVMGDEGFVEWAYDDAVRILQGPIMRHLMRVISPTLVVMGAGSRWAATRKGSELRTEPVKRESDRVWTIAHLSFPEDLYPAFYLEILANSFRAGVNCARASGAKSELAFHAPGEARYIVSWDR
jgi:hypothetical protein